MDYRTARLTGALSRVIVMIATPARMIAAAMIVRDVTDSCPIAQPRNTATTGFTYAYVAAFAALVCASR